MRFTITLVLTFLLLLASSALGVEDTGEQLADFSELRLDGTPIVNSDLEGKVVLMNFWAPWCKPCIEEMPELHSLYERYKEHPDVVVLAVHTGWAEEPIEKIRSFVAEKGYTIPVIYDDDGSLRRAFDSGGIPRNYVIDGVGEIRAMVEPRPLESFVDRAAAEIDRLLAE